MKIGKFIAMLLIAIVSFGSANKVSAQDRYQRTHREYHRTYNNNDYHRSRSYHGYRHDNGHHYGHREYRRTETRRRYYRH